MSKAAELAALIGSQTALSNRNIIINGAMQVAQRGTSSTGIGASAGYFTLDRFKVNPDNTAGRLTMTQTAVTDLPGFANCLKLDCTTADTSIAAGELLLLQHYLEGQELQQLQKGTSSAKAVTVSFYVKGNAAATYTCELFDDDNSRGFPQRFNVTTSWNRISLTFAGDTSGTLDDDNAKSMTLQWWLHAGSTYNGGTQATTWNTGTNTRANSSDTSFFDSTDRTFEITGVQMELGEQATPFEHRSFGDELRRCQRYYAVRENATGGTIYYGNTLQAYNTTSVYGVIADYPVTMRATPTVTQSGTFGAYTANSGNASMPSTIGNLSATSHAWRSGGWDSGSGLTAGHASVLFANNGAKLMADAEL